MNVNLRLVQPNDRGYISIGMYFAIHIPKVTGMKTHIDELVRIVNTFSGYTLTSMLTKRLGMPHEVNCYKWHWTIRAPHGGYVRIKYYQYANSERNETEISLTKNVSSTDAINILNALHYDIIYKTLPHTDAVKQIEPCTRSPLRFDKYAAFAEGLFGIKTVTLCADVPPR